MANASWIYDIILNIFAPLLDLFFREIQVRGSWRVPSDGAVILVVAPHANQFVDGLVLMRIMRSLNRRVSWLMAAKSFKTPIIGSLAMGIGVVPVSRAMDSTKAGEGTIYLPDPNGNPKLLCGIGTTFDGPEFEVGGSIYLPTVNGDSQKLDIAEIRGPNEISLKNAPSHIDALQQLSQPQGTKFKVAPHVDQADVYKAVFDRLRDEGCIGIFPEGGSHDRSDMLPLKAGISIMALGALADGINVTVVPVGLNYFNAHKFRSRAVVEFGDPVPVPSELVQGFKSEKRRESIGALLKYIYQSLVTVTVTAPTFEMLKIVQTARRLYIPRYQHVPLSVVTEVHRRLIKGYTQHKSDPKIQKLSASLAHYSQKLQSLGLRDHQVEYARLSIIRVALTLAYRIGKFAVLSLGTFPGFVLFLPVFILSKIYSNKKKKEALAGSSVKIEGNDVIATWKILVGGVLAPILYTVYAISLVLWSQYNHMNGYISSAIHTWMIVLGSYVVFPIATYAALRLGEVGMDILKSIWPLILCLSPFSSGALTRLREEKAWLAREVTQLINTLGPDLFPDCDAAKLPQPRKLYSDISPFETLDDLTGSEFF